MACNRTALLIISGRGSLPLPKMAAVLSGIFVLLSTQIPFIALRGGNDTRDRMDTLFATASTPPNIHLEVDQLATAYNIACNRLGATLVSDTLVDNAPPNPEMDFYKLDSATATRSIYLYYKHSRYVSLAMQKFLDVADAFFSERELQAKKAE